MNILDKVKAYGFMALSILLGVLLLVQSQRLSSTKVDYANDKAKWSEATKVADQAALKQSEAYRTLERKYSDDLASIQKFTAKELQAANDSAASARAASARVSSDLATYLTSHRERALATTAAGEREAGAKAELLLADLYRRADKRAGELAEFADTSYIRGQSCASSYDKVTTTE